jgi:hypothetical protein
MLGSSASQPFPPTQTRSDSQAAECLQDPTEFTLRAIRRTVLEQHVHDSQGRTPKRTGANYCTSVERNASGVQSGSQVPMEDLRTAVDASHEECGNPDQPLRDGCLLIPPEHTWNYGGQAEVSHTPPTIAPGMIPHPIIQMKFENDGSMVPCR